MSKMLRKGCETGQGFIVTCSLKRSSALDYPLVCLAVYIYCCSGKRVLSGLYSRKLNAQPFGLVLSPGCGKLARSYKERDDEITDKESQTKISPVSI